MNNPVGTVSDGRAIDLSADGQFVYVMFCEAAGAVKVGLAWDPRRRLDQLRVGCPFEIELLRYARGDAGLERRIHLELGHLRVRGEWFDFTEECLEVLLRLLPPDGSDS